MAGLDETSRVLGNIESDVRYIRGVLDGDQGLVGRVERLERGRVYENGKAAGLGILGGGGVVAAWKLLAAKVGFGG